MRCRLSSWQRAAGVRVVDDRLRCHAVPRRDVSASGAESRQRGRGRRAVLTRCKRRQVQRKLRSLPRCAGGQSVFFVLRDLYTVSTKKRPPKHA